MALTFNGSTNTIAGLAVGGLPDGTVDHDMLAAGVNTITEVDMWQITAHFDSGNTTMTSNFSRCGDIPFEKIGTGMSESSGVFTFPSTGKWRIEFSAAAMKASYPRRYITGHILTTQDNSNYEDTYFAYTSTEDVGTDNVYAVSHGKTIFDVTDTSTHKVKFKVTSDGAVTWLSDSTDGIPYTYMVFTRLGDT